LLFPIKIRGSSALTIILRHLAHAHMDAYTQREELVEECIANSSTDSWYFPASVDTKAKDHLQVLVTDHWPKDDKDEDELPMKAKLEVAVNETFREMIREYKRLKIVRLDINDRYRFCKIAKLTYTLREEDMKGKVEKMLLLLSVFGHIDLLRNQNHVTFLLFHAMLPMLAINADTTDSNYKNVADMVLREADFLYKLMKSMFNKNIRNEEFFDWDDLNDLCWTSGFCEAFVGTDGTPSFKRAFRMDEFPNLMLTIEPKKGKEPDNEEVTKEKREFMLMWKTFFDRAGGFMGKFFENPFNNYRVARIPHCIF
jgi:hypothetical protein